MKIFRRIYEFFAKPFKEDFIFLLTMALLVCGPRFIYLSCMQYNGVDMLIWEVAHSYLLCYFAVLVVQVIPLRLRIIYKYIFIY